MFLNIKKLKDCKNAIGILVLTILIIFLILITWKNQDEFKKIFDLGFFQFAILSFLVLLEIIISSIFFKILALQFNLKLSFKKSFFLTSLNNYANYMFAKSGQVARSFYLKKFNNFSYYNYITLYMVLNLVTFISVTLIIFFISILAYYTHTNFNIFLFLISFSALIIFSAPFFLPDKFFNFIRNKNINIHIKNLISDWLKTKFDFLILIYAAVLFMIVVLIVSLKIYLIFLFLYTPIEFSVSVLLTSIGMIAPILSLTPASLGVREGLMAYSSKLLGENFATTIAVTTLDRAVSMFWILIIGIFVSVIFTKKINSKNSQTINKNQEGENFFKNKC